MALGKWNAERQGEFWIAATEAARGGSRHVFYEKLKAILAEADFDDIFKSENIKPIKLHIQSPNFNARCERVIQSIKQGCLHNFLICGEKHLNYLVREYVRYYNDNRAHSSRDFLPPSCSDPPPENETIVLDDIVRHERFGGLINWYQRTA